MTLFQLSRINSQLSKERSVAALSEEHLGQQQTEGLRNRFVRFSSWLEAQEKREDTVGKLVSFVRSDRCWPWRASEYVVFRNHVRIVHTNVPIAQITALDEAWEEYLVALRSFARKGKV